MLPLNLWLWKPILAFVWLRGFMSLQSCQGSMESTVYINLWISLVLFCQWSITTLKIHSKHLTFYFIYIQQNSVVNLTHFWQIFMLMFHKIYKLLVGIDLSRQLIKHWSVTFFCCCLFFLFHFDVDLDGQGEGRSCYDTDAKLERQSFPSRESSLPLQWTAYNPGCHSLLA